MQQHVVRSDGGGGVCDSNALRACRAVGESFARPSSRHLGSAMWRAYTPARAHALELLQVHGCIVDISKPSSESLYAMDSTIDTSGVTSKAWLRRGSGVRFRPPNPPSRTKG